jgi:hypothetical protein
MNAVQVTILRDAEDAHRHWWLAHVAFNGRPYVTQGETVDETRFMAADLLATLGASDDTVIAFDVADEATVGGLLGRSATALP